MTRVGSHDLPSGVVGKKKGAVFSGLAKEISPRQTKSSKKNKLKSIGVVLESKDMINSPRSLRSMKSLARDKK